LICADRSGAIIRRNRAAAALFGYSAEEILGQSIDRIIPEHLRAPHWSGFEAAMTRGALMLQGRPTLTRALHKSWRKLYVEMTFAIVNGDAESEVLGAVAVARDVTDRVEQERATGRSSRKIIYATHRRVAAETVARLSRSQGWAPLPRCLTTWRSGP
jgi:PAS domain S-box-containing protein